MKVDVVVTQLEPGGAQKAAVNLSNYLVAEGHSVRLIFLYKKMDAHFDTDSRVRAFCLQKTVGVYKRIVLSIPKLLVSLGKSQPDVVISFTHWANIYCAVACCLLNLPIVVSNRNPRSSYGLIAGFLDHILCRLGAYKTITHVSNHTRDSFNNSYKWRNNDSLVIHNCVDVTFNGRNIVDCGDYIISVGRFFPQKNHELLLRAFSRSTYIGDLVLVGSGPLERDLRNLASELGVSDRVRFLSGLKNNEVLDLVARSKAFYMPSLFEGMSNALLEAIALGIHTVVSDVPPQVEAVTTPSGIYGEVLDINDIPAWSRSMEKLDQRDKDYVAAKRFLQEHYKLSRFGSDFDRAIKYCIG